MAALGDEVPALDQSYHSAEKRLQMAAIAGIYGLVIRHDALFRGKRFSYPYDMELALMRIIPNGTDHQDIRLGGRFERIPYPLSGLRDGDHPGVFQRALQRMVEIDGIPLSDYPAWLNRLEMIPGLPAGRWEGEPKRALEALADSLDCPGAGFLGGYLMGLVKEVKRFTLLNLGDPQRNLRLAAASLHVSAPYLDRVFKRQANPIQMILINAASSGRGSCCR